ncbi:hypothetical protein SJAG_04096 [Schizosaccharomyces japonicus yFS275]|uniref:GDT1 family protein n=1 Tax=Schizosaccharomyces japonicus (strain yFS275 / FY16936) TaxID=402676 RepID=B6K5X1_SCHJY|nr:hypothetical protein SJAG_04096 [Schizosaccharomyces japonicus yFS275]EEB08925.1 hypothetical protein SJAG_04096 [Schizosaccharomyces japonicus yFS275]
MSVLKNVFVLGMLMASALGCYAADPAELVALGITEKKGLIRSFVFAISMIFGCELGDKTFIVAALLAMENSRVTVFLASYGALALMTLLGCVIGSAVPYLINKQFTDIIGACLFLLFGYKMIQEAREVGEGNAMEEEFLHVSNEIRATDSLPERLEAGANGATKTPKQTLLIRVREGFSNLTTFLLSPTFVKAFSLTFVGEWGDRSQIATVTLAATDNFMMVLLGSLVGHACCTGLAVVSGKLVASKVSPRVLMLFGGALFVLFGLVYMYNGVFPQPE